MMELLNNPTGDKVVQIVLLLAIAIVQLIRFVRPAPNGLEAKGALLKEMRVANDCQKETLETLRELVTAAARLPEIHEDVKAVRIAIAEQRQSEGGRNP